MSRLMETFRAICLAGILAMGAGILLSFAVFAGIGTIVSAWENRSRVENRREFNEYILVTTDGRVVIDNNWESFDLNHHPIEKVEDSERLLGHTMMPRRASYPAALRGQGMSALVISVVDHQTGSEKWSLVVDGPHDDLAYFEGHHRERMQRIGYIGRNGFQQTKPVPADQFPFDPRDLRRFGYDQSGLLVGGSLGAFFLSDGDVMFVDLDSHTVRPLLEGVVDFRPVGQAVGGPAVPSNVAARTATSISVFDEHGQFLYESPIPMEMQDAPLQFYPFDDESVIVAQLTGSEPDSNPDPSLAVIQQEMLVARVGNDGQIESRTPVLVKRRNYGSIDLMSFGIVGAVSPVWTFGFALPLEAAIVWTRNPDLTFRDSMRSTLVRVWPGVVGMLLVTLFVVWKTWQRQRQTGEPGLWAWLAFVAATGVPGYIGYRLHRHWPRTGPLPAIKQTGTEVFA